MLPYPNVVHDARVAVGRVEGGALHVQLFKQLRLHRVQHLAVLACLGAGAIAHGIVALQGSTEGHKGASHRAVVGHDGGGRYNHGQEGGRAARHTHTTTHTHVRESILARVGALEEASGEHGGRVANVGDELVGDACDVGLGQQRAGDAHGVAAAVRAALRGVVKGVPDGACLRQAGSASRVQEAVLGVVGVVQQQVLCTKGGKGLSV